MPNPEGAASPATLTLHGRTTVELPVVESTLGRTALDISGLGQHGLAVYDPGYADTAAYDSAITFVDGEGGRLHTTGATLLTLATSWSFLEVAYLLINGELPSARRRRLHRPGPRPKLVLHVGLERLFDSFPQSMHPMAMLAIATEAMSAYADESAKTDDRSRLEQAGVRLLVGHAHLHRLCPLHPAGPAPGEEQPVARLRRGPPAGFAFPSPVATTWPTTPPPAPSPLLVLHATTSSTARRPPCGWWPGPAPGFTPGYQLP